jgi:hypothetical protein
MDIYQAFLFSFINTLSFLLNSFSLSSLFPYSVAPNSFHKIRNVTRGPTLPIPIQHSTGILAREIRQEEEIKGIQIGK